MVPVKLEEVVIPNIMRIMAMCDFTKKDLRDWSWVRLAQSIRVPLAKADFEVRKGGRDGGMESDREREEEGGIEEWRNVKG